MCSLSLQKKREEKMFITDDQFEERLAKINHMVEQDPSVAFSIAFMLFHWTVKKTIIGMSKTPTIILRDSLKKIIDPPSLKAVWKKEISDEYGHPSITKILSEWEDVKRAYAVHEKMLIGTCTECESQIVTLVNVLTNASDELNQFCKRQKIPLYGKTSTRNLRVVKVV